MPWAALAAAAVSAYASHQGAKQQNVAGQQSAQAQMDFQREMSNTSYQRGMADMRAAGLNPILAYKQGGASSPGGAMYNPVNELGAAVEGGVAGAGAGIKGSLQTATVSNIKADTKLKSAQATSALAEAKRQTDFGQGPIANILDMVERMVTRFTSSAKSAETFVQDLPPKWMPKLKPRASDKSEPMGSLRRHLRDALRKGGKIPPHLLERKY